MSKEIEIWKIIFRNGREIEVQVLETKDNQWVYLAERDIEASSFSCTFPDKTSALVAVTEKLELQHRSVAIRQYRLGNQPDPMPFLSPALLHYEVLATVLRRIVDRNLVWRDGDCIFCHEWLGGVVEQWQVHAGEYSEDRLGDHYGKHKPDCPGIAARKLLGLPVREGMGEA
jgi:hypothetical protein